MTNNIYGNPHKINSWPFSSNSAGYKGVAEYTYSDKREKMRPRLLYTAKSSFIFNREIKGFTDKQKVRELSNTKTALFTTNAKRTSLDRKHKRKGLQKQTWNKK